MYCKKCGYQLQDGDKFCAQCGAKISGSLNDGFKENTFSPMFRKENQEHEEEASRSVSKRNFHIEDFNWDLDGFPTEKKKKTEEINFNWESVMIGGGRESSKSEGSVFDDRAFSYEPKYASDFEEETSLEEELFAEPMQSDDDDSKKTVRIDKFYTFNKKNEEFQALLDKEYNRIKNGQAEEEPENVTLEEITMSAEEDTKFEETSKPLEETVSDFEETERGETSQQTPEVDEEEETDQEVVGVALAGVPDGAMADEEVTETEEIAGGEETAPQNEASDEEVAEAEVKAKGVTAAAEDSDEKADGDAEPETSEKADVKQAEEDCPPSVETETEGDKPKTEAGAESANSKDEQERKLTYDDIFSDDDDDELHPKKKNKALKVIAVILCILVIAELVVLGLRSFAPDSSVTLWIQDLFNSVQAFFSGNNPKG